MDDLLERASLGEHRAAVEAALAEMTANRIVERIWARDHTVWSSKPDEITNRLGWLDSPVVMRDRVPRLETLARTLGGGHPPLTHALLLGMGGSSLAPELFARTFPAAKGRPRLELSVLDSTDPGAVLEAARRHDPMRTVFVVSSKSGGTAETASFFAFFYNRAAERLGAEEAGAHFLAITDPGSSLAETARSLRLRDVFLNEPDIGGRYSALSFFGLVPAALSGVDVGTLLERAGGAARACGPAVPPAENLGACLGAVLGDLAGAGRDKATLVLSPALTAFGDWVEQLIAESTGKDGTGILPVVGEPLGAPEVYGDDRAFVEIALGSDRPGGAALDALEKAGHPVLRLRLEDLYDLGGQFFLWEFATAVAGQRLGIHPFDQPDVEAAKVEARKMMGEYRKTGALPRSEAVPPSPRTLEEFLAGGRPGDYIALQAYVRPTAESAEALLGLRLRLRNRHRLAVTVGYGPRFLHSTGQLHKGDAGNGLFVQLIGEDREDAAIPDAPGSGASAVTFGVLKAAQAMGDRRALVTAGRRVLTVHLGPDPAGDLRRMAEGVA